MPFIKFEHVGMRSHKPAASIYRNFVIAFNQSLIKKYVLNKFTYAILYFNSETSEIGIKFINEGEAHAYRLTIDRSHFVIGCKAFLQHYNIQYPQKKISDIRLEKDMLIVKVEIKKETK